MRKSLGLGIMAAGVCLVAAWSSSFVIAAPSTKPTASTAKKKTPKPTLKWRELEPGLAFGKFTAHIPSPRGDSKIAVLRIDPKRFKFSLLSAGAMKLPRALPIDEWMRKHKLVAAINAGMFEPDGSTVGYSRIDKNVLKSHRKSMYKAYFAADLSKKTRLPAATILDAECDKRARKKESRYRIVLQSIRMISCNGKNLWKKSPRIWSTAALAVDKHGNVLFIHSRSPWDVHDFIDILKEMPLGITRAMYLEGGPEASLAVAAGGVNKLFLGSYETGFNENDHNWRAWALPNIIGVERVKSKGGKK
jgi:hypothetical protein